RAPRAGLLPGAAALPGRAALRVAVREASLPGRCHSLDTVTLATALFGDGIASNLVALGAAYQAGALPLRAASIARAIELNGVAVERNQAAFRAGRLAVHDPGRLPAFQRPGELGREPGAARLAAPRPRAAPRRRTGPPAPPARPR